VLLTSQIGQMGCELILHGVLDDFQTFVLAAVIMKRQMLG